MTDDRFFGTRDFNAYRINNEPITYEIIEGPFQTTSATIYTALLTISESVRRERLSELIGTRIPNTNHIIKGVESWCIARASPGQVVGFSVKETMNENILDTITGEELQIGETKVNKNILDTITGEERWIEEALNRVYTEGNVYEVSSRRVAILELLGLITRTDNFGLSYEVTIVGNAFVSCCYEHRVKYVTDTRNQLKRFVGYKGFKVAPKEV